MTTLRVLGAVLVGALLSSACATGNLQQAQRAEDLQDYDLAVARYTRAVRDNPESRDAQTGLERARLRAAGGHLVPYLRISALCSPSDGAPFS